MVEEVLTEGGHEAGVHEAIEVDEEDEEIDEAHPSTTPIIANPPSPFFFEVSHILLSFAVPKSSSSCHYAQYQTKKSIILKS